jgi:hypothetical protein
MRGLRGILPLIYVIAGLVIAQQHHYLAHLDTLSQILSAVLAVTLWPLVLLDVNLHVVITK